MKISLMLPIALVGQLAATNAFAQSPERDVTVFRMGGPQLGVRLEEVDKDVVARLKLKEEKGALVVEVLEGSAAEKAGLKKDDIIVRFQGESVLTAAQLVRLVRDVPSGRKVDLDVIRAGSPLQVAATLERAEWSGRKGEMPEIAGLDQRLREQIEKGMPRNFNFRLDEGGPGWMTLNREGRGRLGISYTEIDGQLADYFKAPKDNAVLVNSVVAGSAAEKAGIKAGDLLVKLGADSVEVGSDLADAVRRLEGGKATPVTVWRDGKSVDLTVTVEATRRTRIERHRPIS
ncbi:MAG: PDZ domain-containing protein [Vicinamibacteria bacterium]|nr:PDZ domain-containing protein [Vicinamibacteria bacterium]